MPGLDLGAQAAVSWSPTSGVQTGVALTVTKPDGSTELPTVTENGGTYTATVESPFPGRYLLRWTSDTDAYTDVLDVWPEDPRFIVGLGDARAALNIRASDTTNDSDLRLYIAAATVVVEDIVGAVLVRQVEQSADGGKTGIALWERPDPDAVITVTVNGAVLEQDGFTVDYNAAIVYCGGQQSTVSFPRGRQNVVVNYSSGGQAIAPNVRLATRELIRHLWQVGKQATHSTYGHEAEGAPATTPSGFAVPKRVIELCASTPRLPGIA